MRIEEILTESENLEEAPAGFFKQGLKKLGAKAAAKVGMKGTAAGLAQQADAGDRANKLKVDLKAYLGSTGGLGALGQIKQLDAQDLTAFLKQQKLPTNQVPKSGMVPLKSLDDILMKTIQQSNKAKGGTDVGAEPSGAAGGAQGGGAPQGGGGAQGGGAPSPNDKDGDGKDDKTGKVIPMPVKGQGATAGGAADAEIPADVQAMLDQLTPTDKKALAGLI